MSLFNHMKNIHNLGYFERQILINRVGRALIKAQGWQVNIDGNIFESQDPRLLSYTELARIAIEEVKAFTEEIGEKYNINE